ncbi:acyl-CoA synthetase [Actinoplanes palleronii]|uniref:Acyl-CoA synthetase n=1 Tax=Actinoplanes palleronii TaxID=113570 RepID=A0ABQ4B5J1_9ACTN|nr:acyl-CoA synthetase [Actinoplanes palleronii]GIE65916.1 acyl-CoA synthetase [Actinoplanes palleronii]
MNPFVDPVAMEKVPLAERGLPASTYALLEQTAKSFPDREAVVLLGTLGDAPDSFTYPELFQQVTRIANALTRLGVGRGDAVAMPSPNNGEMLAAILGVQAAGVILPINPMLAPEAIGAMLAVSGARVLIAAGPEVHPRVWNLATVLGERLGLKAVLALRPDGARGPGPSLGEKAVPVAYLEEWAAVESADQLVALPPGPDDLAAYFHTGGTTGTPKLAAHTHHNEVFTAWCASSMVSSFDDVTVLCGLPLFHVNGVMTSVLAPMFIGARVVWAGPLGFRDPELMAGLWRLIERYQVTTVAAVPTVLGRLCQLPVDADLSSMKFIVSGSAVLPAQIRDRFESHTGVPICDGYGLTEATCAVAGIQPGRPRRGSVGLRMPYQQVRAVDPEGRPLPTGTTGVLEISGPAVFPGYVTPTGLDQRGLVNDGWLDTGDLGYVDADGFLFITGRKKDVIIRGGHNIDPVVIEEALLIHPDVTAASAVGRPDEHAGEVPVGFVTLRPGAELTEEQLVAWAAGRVPEPAMAPKAVHIIDEIPVTAVGKEFKPALRAETIRRVLAADLSGAEVSVGIEDGTPVAEVVVAVAEADVVRSALGTYPFQWRVRTR